MMSLQELIRTNDWLSVEITLLRLYPDQEKGIKTYKEIFLKLRDITPTKSVMEIVLEQQFDDMTYEPSYVHVSGQQPLPENPTIIENYAIEFVPWSEWLGMSIHPQALKEFSELEIICHCLYEMTFYGFDEETIQKHISDMEKSIEDYKNMTKEEKEANTYSIDDLFKELDED